MSFGPHRIRRKRDGDFPLSGSITVSDSTPTASSLVQNTAVPSDSYSSETGVPLLVSPVSSSTPTAPASTPTTSPPSSGNPISLGTVIGACIGALIAVILAVLLAFYCSKRQKQSTGYSNSRNAANNASRRRSHLEPWKRMNEDTGRREGQEQSMKQRPASGTLGAMFHRTYSTTSGEKSSETHHRESVGTMRHFAKYHPGLAAEMASQNATSGVDAKVPRPPAVLHLVGRGSDMNPPMSWDGETVGGDSFMSLHSSLVSSTSPVMVATAKATPPARSSFLHRWESAEVVHVSQVGSEVSEDGMLHNPFTEKTGSIKTGSIKSKRSSTKGHNPFFSGRDHSVRRVPLPETPKNPFVDPDAPHGSSAAIQSLIAALQEPMASNERIASLRSSLYSGMTADDSESALTVTAFPYPPKPTTSDPTPSRLR